MANNCLVTKEMATVENSSLNKMGQIILHVFGGRTFQIAFSRDRKIKIITPGVTFTNSGASGQTEQTIPASTGSNYTTISTSADCDISIEDKYYLRALNEGRSSYISYDLSDFSYCTGLQMFFQATGATARGNILGLKQCINLTALEFRSPNIIGDLKDLMESTTLVVVTLSNSNNTYSKITGDIANLSKLPNIVDLNMVNMNVTGNVSVFESLSNIRDINLSYISIGLSGSISSFSNHASLRSLQLLDCGGITGNLGQLIVNTPSLKALSLPSDVEWTDADAAIADALLQGNGGTQTQSNYPHYFGGGKHVDSYNS